MKTHALPRRILPLVTLLSGTWLACSAGQGADDVTASEPSTQTTKGGCGKLTAGQSLVAGQTLTACGGQYTLDAQTDGNVVLYNSAGKALWYTETNGTTIGTMGHTTAMQGDGNLVVYNTSGSPLWAAFTQNNPGAYVKLQDDGNLVVYASGGDWLWQSGTAGGVVSGHIPEGIRSGTP
jgi:hypothetical protein